MLPSQEGAKHNMTAINEAQEAESTSYLRRMTERLPQFAADAADRRRHPNDQVVEEAIRKRNNLSTIDDIIDKS